MSNLERNSNNEINELTFRETQRAQEHLLETFSKNLDTFIDRDLEQKLLLYIPFIGSTGLVRIMIGELEFGFKYGKLKERIKAQFKDRASIAFPPINYADEFILQSSEMLPEDVDSIVGERVSLISEANPFQFVRGGQNRLINQDEYHFAGNSEIGPRKFELWVGSKVHFPSQNSKQRLLPAISAPTRIRTSRRRQI